ncbi:MAG TPA: isoprenylcysteine carboxylmethyltransferase family protein [Candidatus Baltobacteraceae bacterium]|nr:isoprenylcysteine carboxylmethyltransferase family protein [Candidatus Baltobacteraceae bacterium]
MNRSSVAAWYRFRSAVFAGIFAVGFLGGWGISVAINGRYLAAFSDLGSRWGHRGVAIGAGIALAVAIGAMALRVWGASYLSASTVWDENPHDQVLVQSGPFAFVRHPLYLGNLLLALGLGAAAPLAGWIFIFAASVIFVNALIRYEEDALKKRHGASYDAYRSSVPSLVPRIPGLRANQSIQPSLVQGLRSEAFTGFLILGVVGIFVVPRYGALAFAFCYLLGVFVQRRIEK